MGDGKYSILEEMGDGNYSILEEKLLQWKGMSFKYLNTDAEKVCITERNYEGC